MIYASIYYAAICTRVEVSGYMRDSSRPAKTIYTVRLDGTPRIHYIHVYCAPYTYNAYMRASVDFQFIFPRGIILRKLAAKRFTARMYVYIYIYGYLYAHAKLLRIY